MSSDKEDQTKEEIQQEKLETELKVLAQFRDNFEKLSKTLTEIIGEEMYKKCVNTDDTKNERTEVLDLFDKIRKIIEDDEKIIDENNSSQNLDKLINSYKDFILIEIKFLKRDMARIYDNSTITGENFRMERGLFYLQFFYDFLLRNDNIKHKLYSLIQKRISKIGQEMGSSDMVKNYFNSQISKLLTENVANIKIKPISDEIKKMSKEIRDLIPRTKSEHVGISMHKIRGGKQNGILWKNMFNKYNRNDLNLISKHYGLKNIEKERNKKSIINKLNAIILYRSGKFNKRKELNSFARFFGINPKLYKRKKHLVQKLNQTIF